MDTVNLNFTHKYFFMIVVDIMRSISRKSRPGIDSIDSAVSFVHMWNQKLEMVENYDFVESNRVS